MKPAVSLFWIHNPQSQHPEGRADPPNYGLSFPGTMAVLLIVSVGDAAA